MGKLEGLIQFTGQLEGLSFYRMNGKIIVRKTGGFNGKKIKEDANFVRVRENGSEFGHCSRLGRYFRTSFSSYLQPLRFPLVHNRVVGLFKALSVLDTAHKRGERTVWKGLQSEDAQRIVGRFEFDKDRAFHTLFPFDYTVHWEEGRLMVSNCVPSLLPNITGATHVTIQFVLLGLDFEHQSPFLQHRSTPLTLALTDTTVQDLAFTCALPECPQVFGLLSVRYVQRMHGEDYLLQAGGLKLVGFREGLLHE
ncbi:MAG: hypothetical protein RLZZ500_43 [Bacteroidota bacterium]|jgi:hypothetical protein